MIYVVQSSHSMLPPSIEICTTDELIAHKHANDLRIRARKEDVDVHVSLKRYPNYGVEE